MKIMPAYAVAPLIPDGATVGVSGLLESGWAEEVGIALEDAFLKSGRPRNLTLVHGAGIGNWKDAGTHHLGHEGLVTKWIGAHTGAAPNMAYLVEQGKCQAYALPQGVVVQLFREIAAHRPGLLTKVGLGTFVDPRVEGGKMNAATVEDYVKVVRFEGDEYLFYKSFPIDVAIIRGTTIDEKGNLTMDAEPLLLEQLPLAQAAKNSGGIVIAQVLYVAKASTLHPKHVKVPGVLIDYAVIAKPEHHMQTAAEIVNPSFAGDLKIPLDKVPPLPMNERLVVARRAAMEFKERAVVNCGVGLPDGLGSVVAEENVADMITLTSESGVIGGAPGVDTAHGRVNLNFGVAYNADAFVEHQAQFDWYDGGGVDIAFLGLAQCDKHGNVNVSKFAGRVMGPGGFVNISQCAKKVVFCGTFTAGGLKVTAGDGKLSVVQEGKEKKFRDEVEQITFSGAYAVKSGQKILYVTERAVFELRNGKMTLTEIAPDVDVQRDILTQMDFTPEIATPLKTIPEAIFRREWGGLRNYVESKNAPLTAEDKVLAGAGSPMS